jgi:hypothetical protein
MSELLHFPEAYPEPEISAELYKSYLWLGHCIFKPRDRYLDEIEIGQTHEVALASQAFMEKDPVARLTEQLSWLTKRAASELGIPQQVPISQRDRLQGYLVEKVPPTGLWYADLDGFIRKDPALAEITSPFADTRIFEEMLRRKVSGRRSASFLEYAGLEKLLPGYLPATSQ